jgi:hypothetical protein
MNTLVETFRNVNDGICAKVWLTVSGKWTVSYHDTDSGEQLQVFTTCETLKQAQRKAHEFAFGRAA